MGAVSRLLFWIAITNRVARTFVRVSCHVMAAMFLNTDYLDDETRTNVRATPCRDIRAGSVLCGMLPSDWLREDARCLPAGK